MRILVVEDEAKIASFLKKGLSEHGYAVDVASCAVEGERLSADNEYDLVILDIMLPDRSGITVAQYLRGHEYTGPILMLTALGSTQDKVQGLDAGADDYLVKPFSFDELLARVRALFRRYGSQNQQTQLKFADIELDLIKRTAVRAGESITLTNKEMALLEYFMRNVERPVSRTELIEHVWDMGFDPGSNVVDVYVNMLRKKVDPNKELIHTVVGHGYVMKAEKA
jgi:two-component system copper resistance phosphate regulon response regulator CusR